MKRYQVEYYSESTGNMICWYSTGSKSEAERLAKHKHSGVKVQIKEVLSVQQ
jgi:hypothetical protein